MKYSAVCLNTTRPLEDAVLPACQQSRVVSTRPPTEFHCPKGRSARREKKPPQVVWDIQHSCGSPLAQTFPRDLK